MFHLALVAALNPSPGPIRALPVASLLGAHESVAAVEVHRGHRYAFVHRPLDRDDAQDFCAAFRMDLVTINSLEEQDWIVERALEPGEEWPPGGMLGGPFWIGVANDAVHGGHSVLDALNVGDWEWVSGESSMVRDFDGSMDWAPDAYDEGGAGVTIDGAGSVGPFGEEHAWRVSPAVHRHAFVCEGRFAVR